MGVMACSRKGCETILCDRYSLKYGYICEECFEELLNRIDTIPIENFMREQKEERHTSLRANQQEVYDTFRF